MRNILLACLLAAAISSAAQNPIRIIEAEGGEPLEAATVFSGDGLILGLSDRNGEFNKIRPEDYPLRISYMGYTPVTLNYGDSPTVSMTPAAFSLNEVTVIPGAHPVQRVVCYMREYLSGMTGKDSMLYFNEHMADFFLTDGKVKGFKQKNHPRLLTSRCYARICNDEVGDSAFIPKERDEMLAWEQMASLPKGSFDLSEIVQSGATHGKVEGKYYTRQTFNVNPRTVITSLDYLADTKDHTMSPLIFKLIGFTMDLTEMQASWVYNRNENEKYDLQELLSGTLNLRVVGRGKIIKKIFKTEQPVEMYASYEIYPVATEYLSVEEAKDMLKNPPVAPMTVSQNASPLPPQIQQLVERLE